MSLCPRAELGDRCPKAMQDLIADMEKCIVIFVVPCGTSSVVSTNSRDNSLGSHSRR